MDMLLWMQELPAAQVIVALLVLPWIGVAATHAASAVSRTRLDDAWTVRADAALRWADAASIAKAPVAPRRVRAISVPRSRASSHAPSHNLHVTRTPAWSRAAVELDAA